MTLPLQGIRVLDLTHVLAGPLCTYQLALMGAEVVKIELPGRGDLARQLGADQAAAKRGMGSSFISVNCGKQSMTLDIKKDEGKGIFKRLVGEADVLVENFRPGVMDRLGLGYEAVSKIQPSIVYCSISGFGKDGPFAHRPAYDQIVQGVSGVMSITGDKNSAPLRVGYPVADTVGGLTAAFAISSALVSARSSGTGSHIDVSMLECLLATMGWVVSDYLNAGVDPQPRGNDNFTASPSGTFRTGDGLMNVAANEDYQFMDLCDVIGRPDLKTDSRFNDRHIRKNHRPELTAELEKVFATRSAAEWVEILGHAGVPAGLVMTVPEILNHPQVRDRGFTHEFDSPNGALRVTRGGFRFHDSNPAPSALAPELSEHTDEWLRRCGYDADGIARLRKEGVV